MKSAFARKDHSRGYTIVEAMVAISLLMLAVGAAASLSMTLVNQEELNARAARALNWQENAVRLFQLGLEPADIRNVLLPELPGMTSFTAATSVVTFDDLPAGDNEVDVTTLTIVYTSDVASGTTRFNSMTAVRY